VFACDVFEIYVYQFKGFFDVVGWFDVVLRSKYTIFLEAFAGNGVLVSGGKPVNGSSSCLWYNSWSPRLLHEFSTNTIYPPIFLKKGITLCSRNGSI